MKHLIRTGMTVNSTANLTAQVLQHVFCVSSATADILPKSVPSKTVSYHGTLPYRRRARRMDVCIQKIRQGGPQGTHFRLVDKSAVLIEDPHTPAIAAISIIYTVIYVYFPE